MKAYAIEGFGEPGSIRELPDPVPAEGEVAVRVAAAGMNPFDASVVRGYLKDRMEHRFPLVPGMDAAGTVEAVGEGVEDWTVGDDVFGSVGRSFLGEGTLAERVTMTAGTIARRPSSLDPAAAAAIPVAGATALVMVEAIAPSRGDVVVVLGATGGVGSYFIQLAANRGAHVVAVCSAPNAVYASALGAAEAIDYAGTDVVETVRSRHPDGIRAIADMHGDKEQVAALAEQVVEHGHVSSAVGAADADALEARGIGASNVYAQVTRERLERLVGMIEAKELIVPELHEFTLAQAAEAIEEVGSGHVRGKIVVRP
jgi:NADPH:quinone reductase